MNSVISFIPSLTVASLAESISNSCITLPIFSKSWPILTKSSWTNTLVVSSFSTNIAISDLRALTNLICLPCKFSTKNILLLDSANIASYPSPLPLVPTVGNTFLNFIKSAVPFSFMNCTLYSLSINTPDTSTKLVIIPTIDPATYPNLANTLTMSLELFNSISVFLLAFKYLTVS